MEILDAVDSHLEYCPWKSAEAQATETIVGHRSTSDDSSPEKVRVPGWILVYQAIARSNNKKRSTGSSTSAAASEAGVTTTGSSESLTPEQREKKMSDLFRRIKEIKKPFNVKALLKRKDKTKV